MLNSGTVLFLTSGTVTRMLVKNVYSYQLSHVVSFQTSIFMLGLSKRMKEMCTSINELTYMSKTGKSNHQILTLAMAEFSSVDLGSMTASSYLYSIGTYIGDIIHSAVTGNRSTTDILFANYIYIFCEFKTTGQLKLVLNMFFDAVTIPYTNQ